LSNAAQATLGMTLAICFPKEVLIRALRPLGVSLFRPLGISFLVFWAVSSLYGATVAGAARAAQPDPQEDREPVIRFVHNPEAAPEFELRTLDGKILKLADASGKVVLLNFWATWCGPCRMEIPGLIELQKQYKDSLLIIGLLVDVDDVEDAKKFVRDAGLNYPVVVATDDIRIRYGGISALPTLFVLDTQGRIVQKHVGLYDPRLYELETRALLNLAIPLKVEMFEDTGEIFLKNARRAAELPGVDLASLTAEQKSVALRALNAETCTCGCSLTLAQCRIYDSACHTSKERAGRIVAEASAKPAGNAEAPALNTPVLAPEAGTALVASPEKRPPQK
jgi:thiol-disulfide isomerase/thioredoxin